MARRVDRKSPEGLKKRLDELLKKPENQVAKSSGWSEGLGASKASGR